MLFSKTFVWHQEIVASGVYETNVSGPYKEQDKYITVRQINYFDQAEVINDILLVDGKAIALNGSDINIIVEQWTKTFLLILEKHAPVQNRLVSKNFFHWLTKELKQLSVARHKFKEQAVHFKFNILMKAFGLTRNKVDTLKIELKRDILQTKLSRKRVILKVLGKLSIRFLTRNKNHTDCYT